VNERDKEKHPVRQDELQRDAPQGNNSNVHGRRFLAVPTGSEAPKAGEDAEEHRGGHCDDALQVRRPPDRRGHLLLLLLVAITHAEEGDVPRLEVEIVGAVSEAADPPLTVPEPEPLRLSERSEVDRHPYVASGLGARADHAEFGGVGGVVAVEVEGDGGTG